MTTGDASASVVIISHRILGVTVMIERMYLIPAAGNSSCLDFVTEKFLPTSTLY